MHISLFFTICKETNNVYKKHQENSYKTYYTFSDITRATDLADLELVSDCFEAYGIVSYIFS